MKEDSKRTYYAMFFCLAITLHNLEEALWLPQWSQMGLKFQKPITPIEFHFAVLIITALAYFVSFLFLSFPKSRIIKWTFIGFLGSMIFNAIFPHIIATILLKTYAPGLVTAVTLNIPINIIFLYRLHKQNLIRVIEIVIATVVVGILLLAVIPILFAFGGTLINY